MNHDESNPGTGAALCNFGMSNLEGSLKHDETRIFIVVFSEGTA